MTKYEICMHGEPYFMRGCGYDMELTVHQLLALPEEAAIERVHLLCDPDRNMEVFLEHC